MTAQVEEGQRAKGGQCGSAIGKAWEAKAAWGTALIRGARGARSTRGAREAWTRQNCLRRSKLELRGPRSGLEIDTRSPGGTRSVPFSRR
eukprot:1236136-Alexandrium_andersonii.AAC.1